ncbi:uncharacterized protein LOC134748822 isoform X3 [Cydia strobilella]|uniref:uncharacterized protein LOC134748822 isoform X3 n=1 Tax=Cydia strobilella TaxID=1100964 RepID=UPI00300578A9
MTELKRLKIMRGQVKATMTRIEQFVNDPNSLSSASLDTLEARKEKLASSLKDYETIQLDILSLDDKDAEDAGDFEDRYFSTIAKINETLRSLRGSDTIQAAGVSSSKLPHVDIPVYNGKDFTLFRPFYEMFIAVIDKNKTLSDVQKLFYLRKFLSDEALSVIINLPLVNASYPEALELLKKRYDNKSRLIISHIHVILDIPCMAKGTAASIRSFVSQVQQQLHALKNLKEPVDKWDMLLISILSRKLDQYTSRAFHLERDPQALPMMSEFIAFLERRAMALEDSSPQKSILNENVGTSQLKSYPKVTNVVASLPGCKFCTKPGHAIYNCVKFQEASVEDRLAFVWAL